MSLNDKLNEPLAKFCAITHKDNWEMLVNRNGLKIFYPSNYNGDRLKKNIDVTFHILEKNSNAIL